MATLTADRAGERRPPLPLRLAAAPAAAAVVVLGVWLAGGVLTNDFAVAMWLVAGWLAGAGVVALGVALRSRAFRVPVLGGYAVAAGAVALYLGAAMFLDRVVDEQVAQAGAGATLVRAGGFEPVRHAAAGEARVLELADGGRVLTLTDFDVDNGPDLRVYLVAGPARAESDVDDFVDLGSLKGNRGNQQYALPAALDVDRYATVVIWCRAFSVLFARAATREEQT